MRQYLGSFVSWRVDDNYYVELMKGMNALRIKLIAI